MDGWSAPPGWPGGGCKLAGNKIGDWWVAVLSEFLALVQYSKKLIIKSFSVFLFNGLNNKCGPPLSINK